MNLFWYVLNFIGQYLTQNFRISKINALQKNVITVLAKTNFLGRLIF